MKVAQNILVLTENFPPKSGGSGRWFWELYSRLKMETGNSITIVTDDDIPQGSDITNHNFEIVRMPLRSMEWGFKSLVGLKFYWQSVVQIRKLIKQKNITQIHCGRVIHEGVIAWLLSFVTGVEYICYIHGEDIETAAVSREHNLMVKQVCKKSNKLICNSINSVNIAKRLNYAEDSKLCVLYPGVDSKCFIPAKKDDEIRKKLMWTDKFVVITVGRLQARKGHDLMIKSIPKIMKKVPNFIYGVIGDGECKKELIQLANDLGVVNQVQFLSEISDEKMISCYQQSDVFILPNRTIGNDIEGFGMVLVEAQACGIPVIAGDSGGTKETMLDGITGFIIDCTNEDIISQKICEMAFAPERLVKMGIAGRKHVEEKLDWDAHVIKASQIFSK